MANNPNVIPYGASQEEDEDIDYSQGQVAAPTAYQQPGVEGVGANTQFIAPMDANGLQYSTESKKEDTRTEAEKAAGEMEAKREEYLTAYRQSQEDGSASKYSKGGYQYQTEPTDGDKWSETLLKGAAALFMVGMPAAGIAAAAATWMGASDRQHRYKQIGYLEKAGYKPEKIDAWVSTGDQRLLAEDKMENKFVSLGAGKMGNTQTGEILGGGTAGGMADGKKDIDWGNYTFKDGTKGIIKLSNGTPVPGSDPEGVTLIRMTSSKADKGKGAGGDKEDTKGTGHRKVNGVWYITNANGDNVKAETSQAVIDQLDFNDRNKQLGEGKGLGNMPVSVQNSLKDGQGNSVMLGSRALRGYEDAMTVFDKASPEGWKGYFLHGVNKFLPKPAEDAAIQTWDNSGKTVAKAILRKESGAAIGDAEEKDFLDNNWPRPGESAAEVARKIKFMRDNIRDVSYTMGEAAPYFLNDMNSMVDRIESQFATREAAIAEKGKAPNSLGDEFDATSKVKGKGQGTTSNTNDYASEYPEFSNFTESRGYVVGRNKQTGKLQKLRKLK